MVICPDCGKEVKDAKFCSNCGSLLPKVEDVVSVGQEVTVRVKEVTPEGKINLSMKPARPEKPARPALDLDKAITNFLKDSDEKQSALKKNMKTQRRRSN